MALKKSTIILLIILGFFVVSGLFVILGIRAAFNNKPVVHKDSVLKITLSGLMTEHFAQDAVVRGFEGAHLQMFDLYQALAMAKRDDRIRGLYLKIDSPRIGWAKAQEIRNYIETFKNSGKFVVAFLQSCNELSYYLALPADEIYLQPHASVALNGFAAEVPFLKRSLNKLGIQPEVENIGKYKSAGDVFKRDSMSAAQREATDALLTDIYDEFLDRVHSERDIDSSTFADALNAGIFRSDEALKLGLVDSLIYETTVRDLLKRKVLGDSTKDIAAKRLRLISASRYSKIPPKEVGLGKGQKIALVYAIGTIMPGGNGYDPIFGRNMGSEAMIKTLESANKNKSIKAIIVRVDSPGGSGVASDRIWAEIEKVRKSKPVIISMSDLAASGGYWIAMNSDAIVAQPLTITGSIGVVSTLFDLSGTYKKLGVVWETVKKGDHADMLTDKRPLTAEERKLFKEMTYDFYQTFVQKAAEGRNKTWDEIHKIAQGRVWTGVRAKQFGLVDSLGSLDLALTIAKRKAKIDENAPVQWVVYPQPKGFLETLLRELSVRVASVFMPKARKWSLLDSLPREMKSLLKEIAIVQQVRAGQMMAILPFVPEIR
ncbi:MAG: signal peptide peptidase SppA [bacterium]